MVRDRIPGRAAKTGTGAGTIPGLATRVAAGPGTTHAQRHRDLSSCHRAGPGAGSRTGPATGRGRPAVERGRGAARLCHARRCLARSGDEPAARRQLAKDRADGAHRPLPRGSIRVIDGRGYDDAGRVTFNAFGIVSYDPVKRSYTLRAHAQGLVGDFAFTATGDGYTWEIPTGPGTLRYTATVKDGELHEVGDRIAPGREPLRVFDMRLKRIGDTDWPAAGAVSPK